MRRTKQGARKITLDERLHKQLSQQNRGGSRSIGPKRGLPARLFYMPPSRQKSAYSGMLLMPFSKPKFFCEARSA